MTLYDRETLVHTLVYHWPTINNACTCGWNELGRSHPEHVANVYEESMLDLGGLDGDYAPTIKVTGFCRPHNLVNCWECRDAPREQGPVRP